MNIKVPPEQREYTIHFGNSIFPQIAQNLRESPVGRRYAIITDSNVVLHAEHLSSRLRNESIDSIILHFPAGEVNKTSKTAKALRGQMHEAGIERSDAVIAVGGGVVGDVAAYAAGAYLRGIPVVQVPTTTVSQADSCIGGKAGVDNEYGKNQEGLFHYPARVFIDVNTLNTLPEREYLQGLAETVKHAVIRDKRYFKHLQDKLCELHNREEQALLGIAFENCRIKGEVVEEDPQEKGLRRILNYGHTAGHAIETLSRYQMLHGEAVAIGMMVAARIATEYGFPQSEVEAQETLLSELMLRTTIPESITNDQILEVMKHDKKARDGRPRFCLPKRTGEMHEFEGNYVTNVDPRIVEKALNETRL